MSRSEIRQETPGQTTVWDDGHYVCGQAGVPPGAARSQPPKETTTVVRLFAYSLPTVLYSLLYLGQRNNQAADFGSGWIFDQYP